MDLGGEAGPLQRDHHRRHNKITARLREAGLGALTDLGFTGLDDDPDDPVVITGRKASRGKPLPQHRRR
ncbi:hypothetical protein ACFYXH_41545 [Streptomyces sp. NPDC002730]|uniref:hypothetical protein n=1 Tax=Streptomyces sp. NPDC002730 TaxID=3364662 RepID=UPI0036782978